MHARFKLVKAKADISNENKSVKRFDKVGDDLGQIDLGVKRFVFITSPAQYPIHNTEASFHGCSTNWQGL
jgi:hypothetical protein